MWSDEGFRFYVSSDEVKLAEAFVVVWLTHKQQNREISGSRTWPLVKTILTNEFTSVGKWLFPSVLLSYIHVQRLG